MAEVPIDAGPVWEAVILAGGSGSRMGGADKPALLVGTGSLLDRVLAAVTGARHVQVVGPPRPVTGARVSVVREHPPGGGPVAALATALPHVRCGWVAVLAADLPFVTGAAIGRLLAADSADAATRASVAVAVDGDGRDQLLLTVWSTPVLRTALAALGPPAGARMRDLLGAVQPQQIVRVALPGDPPPWLDCDTEAELRSARLLATSGVVSPGRAPGVPRFAPVGPGRAGA